MTDNVIGKLTVNTSAKGVNYISPTWGSFTLNLEQNGVTRQLQCGIGETVMPQIEPGDYNVSVENDEACNVAVPNIVHIGNEGYIEASVTPKYTMEITKSVNGKQQDYEFQFVDYADLGTYKGYDATIFAVAPYEVYSLQDLATNHRSDNQSTAYLHKTQVRFLKLLLGTSEAGKRLKTEQNTYVEILHTGVQR